MNDISEKVLKQSPINDTEIYHANSFFKKISFKKKLLMELGPFRTGLVDPFFYLVVCTTSSLRTSSFISK